MRKGTSAVLVSVMLILISISGLLSFSIFNTHLNSQITSDSELEVSDIKPVQVISKSNNVIYLKNNLDKNLTTKNIIVNSQECLQNKVLKPKMNKISLENCSFTTNSENKL